jgi:mannosyl-oligosaccharide glucosidase
MGMMTKTLKNIATILDYSDDAAEYQTIETAIVRNIDDLHWSDKEKCYCDATIDDYEENVLVCHKGYISLFPFLTGLMDPKSDKLGHVLDLLGDEEELWCEFGIRSLSKKDEFYGTDENYWRGPIWMNMNYLAVVQLLVCLSNHLCLLDCVTDIVYRDLRKPLAHTKRRPQTSTGASVSISSKQYSTHGGRQVLPGSSITPRRVGGSEQPTSLAGHPSWSRSWACLI